MKALINFRLASGLVAAMFAMPTASGAITPHALFTDGAVLQQKANVPVWGTSDQAEEVTVSIAGQKVSTKPQDGRWKVVLAPLAAGGPHVMLIEQGQSKVEVKNVLVGEVWICGGQSNMQWTLKQSDGGGEAIATSANDKIRLLTVPRKHADKPETGLEAKWEAAGPSSTPEFSAVGYFFGREMQKQLSVPIGLIGSNYGGTAAEQWMSKESIESNAELKDMSKPQGASTLVQRDDRSVGALCDSRRHLVSGRVQRRPSLSIQNAAAGDDRELARDVRPGRLSVLDRADRALRADRARAVGQHLGRNSRRSVARQPGGAEDFADRDHRRR